MGASFSPAGVARSVGSFFSSPAQPPPNFVLAGGRSGRPATPALSRLSHRPGYPTQCRHGQPYSAARSSEPLASSASGGPAVGADALILRAAKPSTSPSTITPASPSPACCPIRRPKPQSTFYESQLLSMPGTASPFAACSPTTDTAIAPTAFAPPVR